MNHFNKGIIDATLNAFPVNRKLEYIVEVGIGSGKAIQLLAKKYPKAKIIGVDYSKTMLESTKRRNRKLIKSNRLKLQLSSIDTMEIESNSVDLLFTINTLYFWSDPDAVCREIMRVLKENASFILSFNPGEEMNKEAYPSDIFTFYSVEEVKAILERNKFKIESIESVSDRYEKYVCIVSSS